MAEFVVKQDDSVTPPPAAQQGQPVAQAEPVVQPVVAVNQAEMDNESLQILNTEIPFNELKFDENAFKMFLAQSVSLKFDEKMQIIQNVPGLKQPQIDQLIAILKRENESYTALLKNHKESMKSIEDQRIEAEAELEKEIMENLTTAADRAKLDRLRREIEEELT